MTTQYALCALGYECPPVFDTLIEAKRVMADNVKADRVMSSNKLVAIRHSPIHIELKIGCQQSVHTWSEYWIVEI